MMKTIHVDGGSSAVGYFDFEQGGWAARLRLDAMRDTSHDITSPTHLDNRALPGRTLLAIKRTVEADTAAARRGGRVVLVVQAGLNEAKIFPGEQRPIVSLELFSKNVELLGGIAARSEMGLVLVGPQPIDDERTNPSPSGCILEDDLVAEYGEVLRAGAQELGVPYVDTRAVVEQSGLYADRLLAADGYHFNEQGHALLHGVVQDVLVSMDMLRSR
jgi:lysophospholipase L1-like esterase